MTEAEMAKARAFARAAVANHQAKGSGTTYGHKGPAVGIQALGAAAEIAVARALRLPWDDRIGAQPPGTPDVGPLHIRHTTHDHGGLLLHPKDPDMDVHVLVTGMPPNLIIRGWIGGKAGKARRYWTEPQPGRGCYKVPQADLADLGLLEPMLKLWRWANDWDGVPHDPERDLAVLPASALVREVRA